jgi:hypothetical protein
MRLLLTAVLVLSLVGVASAYDLGNTVGPKPISQPPQGGGDGREGGENAATAVPIASLPFSDTGNTCDNLNDYDAVCPYSGSISPDVVYSYVAPADGFLQIDLCASQYDTKVYVLNAGLAVVDCNDDAGCGYSGWQSLIEAAPVMSGQLYYIVVDGYGGGCGSYDIQVTSFEPPPPCIVDCPPDAVLEGEPVLGSLPDDPYNGGCNSPEYGSPFQVLPIGDFCGKSGWPNTAGTRDTDWFLAEIGPYGYLNWDMLAEQGTYMFLLSPQDCATVAVEELLQLTPCVLGQMSFFGNPGDVVWLWVGPDDYYPPAGFVGTEYTYHSYTDDGTVATEASTWGGVKDLYR